MELDAVGWTGRALRRPECVLATAAGELYTSDWRGGVARLRADGEAELVLPRRSEGRTLRPNGIALRATPGTRRCIGAGTEPHGVSP